MQLVKRKRNPLLAALGRRKTHSFDEELWFKNRSALSVQSSPGHILKPCLNPQIGSGPPVAALQAQDNHLALCSRECVIINWGVCLLGSWLLLPADINSVKAGARSVCISR